MTQLTKLCWLLMIAAIIMAMCSCEPKLDKPFVIVHKGEPDDKLSFYQYQDNNGYREFFYDSCNKYNIGDTIK